MPKKTAEERRQEISQAFEDIQREVPRVFESENFKNYLDMNARLHSYSMNNLIMIGLQKPEATMVAGYQAWQKQFNRTVNKGEKGIAILAPMPYRFKREVDRVDENGSKVIGADGQPEKEEREFQGMSFRKVYVFDVSQTSGEPLPEIAVELTGNSAEATRLLEAVQSVCDVPIQFRTPEDDAILQNAHGYFSRATGEIVVNNNTASDQKAKTLIHEWAHSRLHNEDTGKSRGQREIEAEATAYVVTKYFGLDTGTYSFEYVAAYAAGKEEKELKDILTGIQKNANEMISSIDEMFSLIKERDQELEEKIANEEKQEFLTSVMKIAGYEYDDINSSDGDLHFADSYGQTMHVESWDDVKEWLEGVVFDDPDISDAVEKAMHPERFENENAKEKHEQETEKPAEKNVEKPADEKTPDKKIEDFGQKIGGARKDLWAARGLSEEDLKHMNDAERASFVKKDSIWPKPDYQQMYDEGVPREVCWFIKSVRDKIPTKPLPASDMEAEQKKYINFVAELRDGLMACKDFDAIKDMAVFFQENGFVERPAGSIYASYEPTEKAGRYLDNKLFKAIQKGQDPYTLSREVNKKEFLFTEEEKIMKRYRFEPLDNDRMRLDDNGSKVSIKILTGQLFAYPKNGVDLNTMKEGEWAVIEGSKVIGAGFKDEAACKEYVLNLEKEKDKPEKASSGRKTSLKPPQLADVERSGGEDYRGGIDATGQDYLDDFGFKGGEFGNWTNQNDRQTSLNMGYDAFKDLAKALNIADADIALGGNLSIAFGARGQGAALAHYEPMREVINLTKMKGAGSLGHEWIHAIDDYTGKQLDLKPVKDNKMMSECSSHANKNIIPESFHSLMDAIKYKTVQGDEKLEHYTKQLDTQCAEFRSGLESISRAGKTPELEAQRQELISAVVDEAKQSYDYQSQTMAMKRGRPSLQRDKTPSPAYQAFIDFQKENGDTNPNVERNRTWANARRESIGQASDQIVNHSAELPDIRTHTQFVSDANYIDSVHSKSGHGYWSSDCELLARAGAAYIKDKCEELGIRNDYLSGHADCPPLIDDAGSKHFISPQGKERLIIDNAFDKFFEELREMELFHENEMEQPSLDAVVDNASAVQATQEEGPSKENEKDYEIGA